MNEGFDMRSWKIDQINYYRKYLSGFSRGTTEYDIIARGISELEKTV